MKTLTTTLSLLLACINIQAQISLADSTATTVIPPQTDSITVYEMAKGVYCTPSYSFLRQGQLLELQKTKKVIIIKNQSK